MKVFISADTEQFKACREALASDLRAVGCEVKVQEDFQTGTRTLIERLEEYVAQCDRVVVLVGSAYGSPAQAPGLPDGRPGRSYTQWEYYFAKGERLLGDAAPPRSVYLYFASGEYLAQHAVNQSAADEAHQSAFRTDLEHSSQRRVTFGSLDGLCRLMLRDGFSFQNLTPKPNNLPFASIGTLFKGRDRFLGDLRATLISGQGHAAIVSRQAILGLGGVGKTRVAVEYGLRHKAEYAALLFVIADSPEALRRNLAALCGPLVLNLPEKNAREEAAQEQAALTWLHEHPGWFLIIDNVDTPEAASAVELLIDTLRHGHVAITTRQSNWSAGVTPLDLDVLAEADAAAFLLEGTVGRRRETPTDEADARVLAHDLKGLAITLEQARAYISKLGISFCDYLRRWHERGDEVATWHDPVLMKYPRSVAATWDTTVQQLSPAAQALLQALSWFAPEPMPRGVFETPDSGKVMADALALLGKPEKDGALSAERVLVELSAFSMVTWEEGNTAFTVHRLVLEVTRSRVPPALSGPWVLTAIALIDAFVPSEPSPEDVLSWPMWSAMRPHVEAVIAHAAPPDLARRASRLMGFLGTHLYARSLSEPAEALMRRALALDETAYGSDHPEVATHLNNLAHLLQTTNRPAEAEPLLRRALKIDEAANHADQRYVAARLNNLAHLLQATNRLAEAEPLKRRALAIDEATYGKDHPNVATDLSNLAILLQDTNRPIEAELLLRRALVIDESALGKDHPTVAVRLNNLAVLLHESDRVIEAKRLMRRALAIDEAAYGKRHRSVAARLNNLAQLLVDTHRFAEAEPLMHRALKIDEAVYGKDHPNVATNLNNLAQLLQNTRRFAEAEPLMRRTLAIDEAAYGKDHPQVATDLINLAQLLRATKRLDEAESFSQRHLSIFFQIAATTGDEHPYMRASLNQYVGLLKAVGRSKTEILASINALGAPHGISMYNLEDQ